VKSAKLALLDTTMRLALVYEREQQRGNKNRATLARSQEDGLPTYSPSEGAEENRTFVLTGNSAALPAA